MESDTRRPLPAEPIDRLIAPLQRFLHVDAAGGVVLLVCTAVALALANSPWADAWIALWKTPLTLGLGGFEMRHPLKHWINDGLMAVFFFVIGLEVKRELVVGELRDPRRAALPIAAALGGMLVPAAIYLGLQGGGPASAGWGIPMATDIAFVVGCLAVLGTRVPLSLRVMLLSLAIADDIGAILVIAIGYTQSLDLGALALGFVGFAVIYALARLGVRSLLVYVVAGACVWFEFHESGVHATIAGVALGLMAPAHAYVNQEGVAGALERASDVFRGERREHVGGRAAQIRSLERVTREAISPVEYLEAHLHPWVAFFIMPVFALANAGVPLDLGAFTSPVALAVAAGLVVGKPVGVVLFSWVAIRLGIAAMPREIGWDVLWGAGALAGIGFTMALFIAGLALEGPLLDAAKVGTLGGSVVSAALGMALLARRLPQKSLPPAERAA